MINHSENGQGIKVDIQTIGVEMNHYLQRKIQLMTQKIKEPASTGRLHRCVPEACYRRTTPLRNVTVRFSVPGPDVVASDSELRWKIVLKNVEKKLLRQLEKRKAMERNKQ